MLAGVASVGRAETGNATGTVDAAVEAAEAFVRVRYGQVGVDEERPFVARDLGEDWEVKGTRPGRHAAPA